MSKESDTYKKYFDDVTVNLFNTFALMDELESENEELKARNEKLVKCFNQVLLKYEKDERLRRTMRKNAGIIL